MKKNIESYYELLINLIMKSNKIKDEYIKEGFVILPIGVDFGLTLIKTEDIPKVSKVKYQGEILEINESGVPLNKEYERKLLELLQNLFMIFKQFKDLI